MGERQSDGGRAGRRRVHPECRSERAERTEPSERAVGIAPSASVSVEGAVGDTARLEALLAAALVRDGVDATAEQRAVAAFVAARESGAHGARTRRRDDWRASRRRFGGRSLRATLGTLVAGCALSGVAVAGINAAGASGGGRSEDTGPSRTPSAGSSAPEVPAAPEGPGTSEAPDPSGSGAAGTPEASASAGAGGDGERRRSGRAEAVAGDAEAQCRAYERVAGEGRALDATAWKRLVAAAGGAERVEVYCAGRAATVVPSVPVPAGPSVPPEVSGGEAGAGRPAGEAADTDLSGEGEGEGKGKGAGAGRKP